MLWIGAQEDSIVPFDIMKIVIPQRISLSKLMDLSESELPGVSANNIKKFFVRTKNIDERKYQRIWSNTRRENICLITYDDPYFPKKLKTLSTNRTILFYHKGERLPFEKCIAIVGTRNCSTKAAEFTRELSRKVAQQGNIVVAGLALGLDTVAHRGALSVGGKSIAVLPWIFNPSPRSNWKLLDEITKNGFAISDTFLNTEGMRAAGKFVHRNEIISGISDVLVAVESTTSGGTTHQVQIALKQKKPIITLEPSKENAFAYEGFEKFVDLGANPVKSVEEAFTLIEKLRNEKVEIDTTLSDF